MESHSVRVSFFGPSVVVVVVVVGSLAIYHYGWLAGCGSRCLRWFWFSTHLKSWWWAHRKNAQTLETPLHIYLMRGSEENAARQEMVSIESGGRILKNDYDIFWQRGGGGADFRGRFRAVEGWCEVELGVVDPKRAG